MPAAAKYTLVFLMASTWKWIYYAPNTLQEAYAADDPDDERGIGQRDPEEAQDQDRAEPDKSLCHVLRLERCLSISNPFEDVLGAAGSK